VRLLEGELMDHRLAWADSAASNELPLKVSLGHAGTLAARPLFDA
jgi:hypothetical protein